MIDAKLPNGGSAWFVRTKGRSHCGLKPASMEGRLLTGVYAAFVSAAVWFFAARDFETPAMIAGTTLILAATFLYILTALRMSASAPEIGKGRRR
jgi:hypothetical protein